MHKKIHADAAFMLILAGALALSGCSPGPNKQHKEKTESEYEFADPLTIRADETETGTEIVSEPETETESEIYVPESIDEILSLYIEENVEGRMDYAVECGDMSAKGQYQFATDGEKFHAYDGSRDIYASGSGVAVAVGEDDMKQVCGEYYDEWNLDTLDGFQIVGSETIDNSECWHISAIGDTNAKLLAVCAADGLEGLLSNTVSYEIYFNPESARIIRMDAAMPVLREKDGEEISGEIWVSFMADKFPQDLTIDLPDIPVKQDMDGSYAPGILDPSLNLYKNGTFDIQIVGKDLFRFDAEKTLALQEDNIRSGNSYMEEAYGEASDAIINIYSVNADGRSREDILKDYFTGCSAQSVQASGILTVGNSTYMAADALINSTKTRSYCTANENAGLIITLYFKDAQTAMALEDQMYSMAETPLWAPQNWTIGDKYTITTPEGYSVIQSDSSQLYACMTDGVQEVNIFCMMNSTADQAFTDETGTVEGIAREILAQSDITLDSGEIIKYVAVHESTEAYDCCNYIGFLQKDTDVLEFLIIRKEFDGSDYTDLYRKFASNVAVAASEPETEIGSETAPEQI